MYGYIYETTNIVTGKKYIGQHKSSGFDKDYYGSGVLINRAISKYGKENFSVRIIDTAESRKELNEKEISWIAKLNAVKSDEYYNISAGGDGGHTIAGFTEEQMKEYSKKISNANKKRFEDENYRQEFSKIMKEVGKKFIGTHPSKESIEKNRIAHLRENLSDETLRKMSERNRHEAWNKGKTDCFSEEALKKMSESAKKRGTGFNIGGRIAINDGYMTKYIYECDLELWKEKGWTRGRSAKDISASARGHIGKHYG